MSSLNSADSFDTPKGNDLYPELSSPMYDNAGQSGEPTVTEEIPVVSDEQRQEWQLEMEKVEGEIATLRQVLGSKIRYTAELKRKLGITPLQELKQDFQHGVKSIKESNTYQKTNDKLHEINDKIHQSSAYQKTSAVAKSAADKTTSVVTGIGSSVSKKLGDLRGSTASTHRNLQTYPTRIERYVGALSYTEKPRFLCRRMPKHTARCGWEILRLSSLWKAKLVLLMLQ